MFCCYLICTVSDVSLIHVWLPVATLLDNDSSFKNLCRPSHSDGLIQLKQSKIEMSHWLKCGGWCRGLYVPTSVTVWVTKIYVGNVQDLLVYLITLKSFNCCRLYFCPQLFRYIWPVLTTILRSSMCKGESSLTRHVSTSCDQIVIRLSKLTDWWLAIKFLPNCAIIFITITYWAKHHEQKP